VNTAITPDDALEQRYGSDGKIIPGVAARLVHPETGAVLPAGAEGELQAMSLLCGITCWFAVVVVCRGGYGGKSPVDLREATRRLGIVRYGQLAV
jgi:hypothetical protein